MSFRKVTENEIKINNSRVKLKPENPLKCLFEEARKEIMGKNRKKCRQAET